MNAYNDRLNAWHLELSILADAIEHVLFRMDASDGLSATAYVLKNHLRDLVETCPFPDDGKTEGGSHD